MKKHLSAKTKWLIVAAVLAALVAAVLLISRRMHSQTVNVYAVSDIHQHGYAAFQDDGGRHG